MSDGPLIRGSSHSDRQFNPFRFSQGAGFRNFPTCLLLFFMRSCVPHAGSGRTDVPLSPAGVPGTGRSNRDSKGVDYLVEFLDIFGPGCT